MDVLLNRHGLIAKGVCLLGFLTQRTCPTEQVDAEVAATGAGDVPLLAHLAAGDGSTDEVDDRAETQHRMEDARFADLFGHLARRVARQEPGHDADAAVVETSAKTVLKLAGHGLQLQRILSSKPTAIVTIFSCTDEQNSRRRPK